MKTFKDIGGYAIEKEEAAKVADFLKNFDMYTSKGARLPKGMLFYGKPGTGKSLFAQAIVNESGVKAFRLTTEEFYQESSVSLGIKRVFDEAKKEKASVIIIDELDNLVCCESPFTGPSDKQRDALRALLTEIDNAKDSSVLVIATANVTDIHKIPAALVREGRLEKHIRVFLPDEEDRKEIISLYASKSEVFSNIDFADIARYANGFSCSSLETLINEVLIDCIKKDKIAEFKDFLEPIDRISTSTLKKKDNENVSDVAYHEIGHFIADYVLENHIGMLNIVPNCDSSGRYCFLDTYKGNYSAEMIENRCVGLIAGEVACEVFLGKKYLGASSDIRAMLDNFESLAENGLTSEEITAHTYVMDRSEYSRSILKADEFVANAFAAFLKDCKERARKILEENRVLAEEVYKELISKKILTTEEIQVIVDRVKASEKEVSFEDRKDDNTMTIQDKDQKAA